MSYKRRAWYKNLRDVQADHGRVKALNLLDEYMKVARAEHGLIAAFFIFLGEWFNGRRNNKARKATLAMKDYIALLELEVAYLRSTVDAQAHNADQHKQVRKRYAELRHQAFLRSPLARQMAQTERPN